MISRRIIPFIMEKSLSLILYRYLERWDSIELNNGEAIDGINYIDQNLDKYMTLLKLYDRADILNDLV